MLSLHVLLLMELWMNKVSLALVMCFGYGKGCLMYFSVDLLADQSMEDKHAFSCYTVSVVHQVVRFVQRYQCNYAQTKKRNNESDMDLISSGFIRLPVIMSRVSSTQETFFIRKIERDKSGTTGETMN